MIATKFEGHVAGDPMRIDRNIHEIWFGRKTGFVWFTGTPKPTKIPKPAVAHVWVHVASLDCHESQYPNPPCKYTSFDHDMANNDTEHMRNTRKMRFTIAPRAEHKRFGFSDEAMCADPSKNTRTRCHPWNVSAENIEWHDRETWRPWVTRTNMCQC